MSDNYALYALPKSGDIEINKVTKAQFRKFEIGHDLRHVNRQTLFDDFDLDNDH